MQIRYYTGSIIGKLLRIVAHRLIQFNLNVLLEDCLRTRKGMNIAGENKHLLVGYAAASAHSHRKWISFRLSEVPEGRHNVAHGACPERREGEAVGNKAGNGKKAPAGAALRAPAHECGPLPSYRGGEIGGKQSLCVRNGQTNSQSRCYRQAPNCCRTVRNSSHSGDRLVPEKHAIF